ncbi:putative MFS-type transporter [Colletotrichum viniferum]|nr:putative MFS-type transporter [Colletotrichum viniferum]
MAGGIVMFGVTADRGMHWIYPSIGGAFFAFGLGANGDITFTLLIDTYRELTAEAFVGVAFIRNAVSVGVPSALVPWMSSMGLSNMYILSGAIALVRKMFGGLGGSHPHTPAHTRISTRISTSISTRSLQDPCLPSSLLQAICLVVSTVDSIGVLKLGSLYYTLWVMNKT